MSASVTYGRLATTRSNGPFRWVARSPTVKPTTAPSRWALALATSTAGRGATGARAAAAGSGVEGARALGAGERERALHDQLGFRPRDEDRRRDRELPSPAGGRPLEGGGRLP